MNLPFKRNAHGFKNDIQIYRTDFECQAVFFEVFIEQYLQLII